MSGAEARAKQCAQGWLCFACGKARLGFWTGDQTVLRFSVVKFG
jgi:hypothetical protein